MSVGRSPSASGCEVDVAGSSYGFAARSGFISARARPIEAAMSATADSSPLAVAGSAAVVPIRRLVVWDVPTAEELLPRLKRLWPGAQFELQARWELPEPNDQRIPVFLWGEGEATLAIRAGELLREFVYPLVAGHRPCCVAFGSSRAALRPRSLDVSTMSALDAEDIATLLTEDAIEESFPLLGELANRLTLTPIERALQEALVVAGIDATAQAKFGPYRLDFLVEHADRRIALEADGRGFHEPERDAKRDAELRSMGVEKVLRFTGREIFRDAPACAARVAEYLAGRHDGTAPIRRQSLDESQEKAVSHSIGAARVLAPAGAGKTRVLVSRIAALVDNGVEPSSILALAFNVKANEQLVERLGALGIAAASKKLFDPSTPGVVCATFNAFGSRYQRELLELDHRIVTSPDIWRRMMERALQRAGVQLNGAPSGSDPVAEFLCALDRVRADMAIPAEVEVELEQIRECAKIVPFGPVYDEFQRLRLDEGVQSFDDQLHIAVVDLLSNPRHREFVQRRFEHVLVDEYQDLSATQLTLVDIVSRPRRNLFVVGDDDQLIYAWRFADLANILGFHDRLPARPYSATYVLSTNYRCLRAIVDASKRVIDHNTMREPKDIHAAADALPGEVRYFRSASATERTDAVVKFLGDYRADRGRWSELAVLCRYKAQQALVALALDQAGIPRTPLLSYQLFSDRQMQLLRSYIELVRDPDSVDSQELGYMLNRPNRYLTNELVDQITMHTDPWSFVNDRCEQPDAPPALAALCTRQVEMRKGYQQSPPTSVQLLGDIVLGFELELYWRNRRPGLQEIAAADPLQLLGLVQFYAEEIPDPTAFLNHWDAAAAKERERPDTSGDQEDGVVIATMHASKGREYDAVVLFDYDCDLSKLDDTQIEEERRVFYVGLTRARAAALITIDGRGDALNRFVRESIASQQPNEHEHLADRLTARRQLEAELIVSRKRLTEQLERVRSGQEAKRVDEALDDLRTSLADIEGQITQVRPLAEHLSLWARLRGHTANARIQYEELRSARQVLEGQVAELLERATLLAADPTFITESIEDKVREVAGKLEVERATVRATRSRMNQLELLKPA